MRRLIGFCFIALALAGCITVSPNMIQGRESGPDLTQDAMIAMHGNAHGQGILLGYYGPLRDYNIWTAFQEVGTSRHFYLYLRKDRISTAYIPPGTYLVRTYVAGGDPLPLNFEFPPIDWSADSNIPIEPFTVEAGEVVYLGGIMAHGRPIHYEAPVFGARVNVTYQVTVDEALARAAFAERDPELVDQMSRDL